MVWEDGCSSNSKDFCGWRCEEERCRGEYWSGTLEPDFSMKVMTDEQIEILRGQISIYAAICEQLVEMYRDFTARQEPLAGMRLGSMYYPSSSAEVPKSFVRHRWTPTAAQLQILEGIFKQGNGTPSKQKISDIAVELSKHGQVSDAKVYNWFQNRRARSKKKHVVFRESSADLKLDVDADSPNGKKIRLDKVRDHDDLLHPEPGRQLLI